MKTKEAIYIDQYGPVEVRTVLAANPGVNTQLTYLVQGWYWWQLVSLRAVWSNGAGANNLVPVVLMRQSTNPLCLAVSPTALAGGATKDVTFARSGVVATDGLNIDTACLPDFPVVGDGGVEGLFGGAGGNAGSSITGVVLSLIGVRMNPGR